MLLCPTRDTSPPHYLATRVYIASDSLAERHACAKIKGKRLARDMAMISEQWCPNDIEWRQGWHSHRPKATLCSPTNSRSDSRIVANVNLTKWPLTLSVEKQGHSFGTVVLDSFGCSAFVELRPTWLMGGVSVVHSPWHNSRGGAVSHRSGLWEGPGTQRYHKLSSTEPPGWRAFKWWYCYVPWNCFSYTLCAGTDWGAPAMISFRPPLPLNRVMIGHVKQIPIGEIWLLPQQIFHERILFQLVDVGFPYIAYLQQNPVDWLTWKFRWGCHAAKVKCGRSRSHHASQSRNLRILQGNPAISWGFWWQCFLLVVGKLQKTPKWQWLNWNLVGLL